MRGYRKGTRSAASAEIMRTTQRLDADRVKPLHLVTRIGIRALRITNLLATLASRSISTLFRRLQSATVRWRFPTTGYLLQSATWRMAPARLRRELRIGCFPVVDCFPSPAWNKLISLVLLGFLLNSFTVIVAPQFWLSTLKWLCPHGRQTVVLPTYTVRYGIT